MRRHDVHGVRGQHQEIRARALQRLCGRTQHFRCAVPVAAAVCLHYVLEIHTVEYAARAVVVAQGLVDIAVYDLVVSYRGLAGHTPEYTYRFHAVCAPFMYARAGLADHAI